MRQSLRSPQSIAIAAVAAGLAAGGPVAAAQAQSATLGSSLAAAADATFGCETYFQVGDGAGNYYAFPSNQPTCTWWQTGVYQRPSDPRQAFVPGDGTVTRVRVRSGSNPAPVRVTILRQSASIGPSGELYDFACCFGRSESPIFTLTPNAITELVVNLPVESHRDTANGIAVADAVGVSAGAGAGTLPIANVGPHTTDAFITPGSVNAGWVYPKFQPTGEGRTDHSGGPGWELLLQYDWTAAGGGTGGGGTGGGGTGGGGAGGGAGAGTPGAGAGGAAGAARIETGTLRRAGGGRVVVVPVRCTRATPCVGRLLLRTRGAKPKRLGQRSITLMTGARGEVQLTLNATARRLLRRYRSIKATVVFELAEGKIARGVTLRRCPGRLSAATSPPSSRGGTCSTDPRPRRAAGPTAAWTAPAAGSVAAPCRASREQSPACPPRH